MMSRTITTARRTGRWTAAGLMLLGAPAALAAVSLLPATDDSTHGPTTMAPGIARPTPVLALAAIVLVAVRPTTVTGPAERDLSAPRLAYPDLRALDSGVAHLPTWAAPAFVLPVLKPVYGPFIPQPWTARDDDPDRFTTTIAPVATDRPLIIPPDLAPHVAAAAARPPQAPAPVPGAIPGDRPEDLRAAIVDALRQNPDIQIALARQDDAKYGVDEAAAGYYPHMDVAVAIGGEFNDPQLGAATNLRRGEGLLSIRQNVWDFGTTINDIKRARAAYRSAQWATREKIEAISYDIANAYLGVLAQQQLQALADESRAAHAKILKMVTTQNDLGLTTPADVSRAKARLENVEATIQDRKSALESARESYRRLTDHLPGPTVPVPSAQAALPPSADAAVAMIDDHSPRMAQAVQDRRSIDRQRASQTGTFFPKVGLLAQANWRDDVQGRTGNNSDARGMVTVTYGFLNGGADVAIRNRLSARLREADYELERRRREVEQDLRIDFNALDAARAKMATIDAEITASEKVVNLYTTQFREGKRTVFDLLDSQQILFDARANRVANATAMQLAEFRVLQKLGGLFDLLSSGQKLPNLVVPASEQKAFTPQK